MASSAFEQLSNDYVNLEAKAKDLKNENISLQEKLKLAEEEKVKSFSQAFEGSREQKMLRAFGVSNVKNLINTNVCDRKYSHVPLDMKHEILSLKNDIDNARFIAQMFYGAERDRGEADDSQLGKVKCLFDTKFAKERDLAGRIKAFGTGVSGGGAEWIQTLISSAYLDEYLLDKQVMKLFQEVAMPSNPYKLSVKKDGTFAKIVAEGAAASGQNFGTDVLSFDAENKLVEYYELPEELNEDSIVDVLSLGKSEVIESQLKAIETALINGDTTATHMDSDVTVASDARKAWKGLRKLALANSANGSVVTFSAAASHTKLSEMFNAAGKFGVNPKESVLIVSPKVYHQMTAIDQVLTVDKMGALATILNGALAAYMGKAIIVSEYMREDLNVAGVHDGVTTNNSAILLVNKTRFYLGKRRAIRVRVGQDPNIAYDRWLMASYSRYDFKGRTQSATEKSAIIGVDVTIA